MFQTRKSRRTSARSSSCVYVYLSYEAAAVKVNCVFFTFLSLERLIRLFVATRFVTIIVGVPAQVSYFFSSSLSRHGR